MRVEPGLGLGLPGTAPLPTAPSKPRASVTHLAPPRPPPPAEGASVMGGCAGLAGGCAPTCSTTTPCCPKCCKWTLTLSCLFWFLKVKLTNSEGKDFCGGVLIQDNFVLTTAKCSLLYRNTSVRTSEYFVIQFYKMAPETKTILCRNKSESEVAQSCPTLCDPMGCSPPGSSIHGIFQARVLEWVAVSFSR